MSSVWAFENRGQYHFVAESKTEAHAKVGQQIPGDQCEACGSAGWTLRGPLQGPLRVVCEADDQAPGCGRARPLTIQDEDEVIF